MKSKNIVVIGGGTGTYTVLSGLKKYPVHLSAVVAMADDGGSTKILREEFGVLPPGSVRPAIVALSNASEQLSDLFNYRFENGSGLRGHNFGNLLITALTKQLGSFEKAIQEAGKILQIEGEVIPSTLGNCTLYAELENGQVVKGEENIDVPKHDAKLRIKRIWLKPNCNANPRALWAIKNADLIVVGPGDIFSSILPNFLVKGLTSAVKKSKAKKTYVCNVMTKPGETTGYQVHTFVEMLQSHIGKDVLDYVIVNIKKPSKERIKKYELQGSEFVAFQKGNVRNVRPKIIVGDFLRTKGFIRHDPDRLAKALISLL